MKRNIRKPKYSSNHKIEDITTLMSEYISTQTWSKEVEDANAVLLYNDYMSSENGQSKAHYVINKTLFIKVASPALAMEISLKQSEIISYINKSLGKNTIKKLQFKVAELDLK